MSHETASSSSSRSPPRPALPPFLHLTTQENGHECSDRPGGSKPSIKNFSRVFHHVIFPGRFGTVTRLERVAEATLEGEKEVRSARVPRTLRRKTVGRSGSRRSTSSPSVSQSTASHISAPRCPQTLIASYPPLNVSDIPPRSPTNKSPFSAVLLTGEDEEHEVEDPALALWHTEQLHRARLAKLTRHLGEEIPAELVLGPAFLSPGGSRRGGHHHRRRSLDPSTFMQEMSITQSAGVLRRSKSLKEQGDTHPLSSTTVIFPEMPCAEGGGVGGANTKINTSPVPHTGPSPSAAPEPRQVNSDIDVPNNDVLRERVSMGTSSESHPLQSSRPPESRTLPRRPATADTSRRVEKLADFFGVNHGDVSPVTQGHGSTRDLSISSTSAAGDLAVGTHTPPAQVKVTEVRVNKPTRFWNGRTMTKSVHPEDVLDKLRMMKAS